MEKTRSSMHIQPKQLEKLTELFIEYRNKTKLAQMTRTGFLTKALEMLEKDIKEMPETIIDLETNTVKEI